MFKKSQRLSRNEFEGFFKAGRRLHQTDLTIIYNRHFPVLKVGVVVGKKVSKQAVTRNTLKRRVYSTLRKELLKKSCQQGLYIIITKPSFGRLSRQEAHTILEQSIAEVLKGA